MRQEPNSPGHDSWLSTMTEARENCREKLATAMVEVGDPQKTVWPSRARPAMTSSQEAAMHAHISVIDYADLLQPYRKEAGEKWTETLSTVNVGPGYNDVEVSLTVLDQWESLTIEIEESSEDELYGQRSVTKTRRLLLPVRAGRKCYRQLNEIVRDLGFAADMPMRDYDEVDPI